MTAKATSGAQKFLHFLGMLAALWAVGFVIYADYSLSRRVDAPDQKTDAIVVLTGGDKRVEAGLDLFSKRLSKNVYISGVHPGVTEADIRKLSALKLPLCCVALGERATTTAGNARETKEWLESKNFKTIRLVTADYHMTRALQEFALTMPDVKILANPIQQPDLTTKKPELWILLFSEYHKTILRRLMFFFGLDGLAA